MNFCRDNGRRYFVVNFDGNRHIYRVSIIKKIPSVKIRRDSWYSGRNQMMIGCNEQYVDILLFELRKAKRDDRYCSCFEIGYLVSKDVFKEGINYDKF
jgi:hypothetical protein